MSNGVKQKEIAAEKPSKIILLGLLINIQLSIFPLYMALPLVVVILILLFSLWQLTIVVNNKSNPGKILKLLSMATVFISLFYVYGNLFGRLPGISLIILMTLLKLFEIKTVRDCYVVVFSCLFIIATSFFQSQSIWLIIYVVLVVISLMMTMIILSDRRKTVSINNSFRLALRFVVLAFPMMLILFVLFPRIPGPLWALPADAYTAKTGLSEEMSPGSINNMISSSAIAFRVKFDGEIPGHAERYWRGAVLSDYDGRTWRRDDASIKAMANTIYDIESKQQFSYTITLEPTNLNWLLSLEMAKEYESRYRLNREAMLLTNKKINKVLSYRVTSQSDASNEALFEQEDYKNRLLPVNLNPKTIALTRKLLIKSNFDRQQYVSNVLNYLKEEGFVYTLKPGLLGRDAIDDFLFESKRGFCEHYASAFSYLMRAAGIPARIVIGYQGGRLNPLDDYMIVRQSDAHAWTEVWLGEKWIRVDPTAIVSPERIEQGITNAGLEISQLPLFLTSNSRFIKNMEFLYDSFQNSWNQWVIGFDREKQDDFLKSLGFDNASVSNLILLLVACLTIVGLVVSWFVLTQSFIERNIVLKYYKQFCRKFEAYGITRRLNEGPVDFEKRLLKQDDFSTNDKNRISYIIKLYRLLHYGNKENEALEKDYIKKIRAFKLQKSQS